MISGLTPFEHESLRLALSARDAAWWAMAATFLGAAVNAAIVASAFWVQKRQFSRDDLKENRLKLVNIDNTTREIRQLYRTIWKTYTDLTKTSRLLELDISMYVRRLIAAERASAYYERMNLDDPLLIYCLVSARERAEFVKGVVGGLSGNHGRYDAVVEQLSSVCAASLEAMVPVQNIRSRNGLDQLPLPNLSS